MKQKVFITGIAGFIGFHLACKLRHMGIDVVGCDHFSNYYDEQLKRSRADNLTTLGAIVHEIDLKNLKEKISLFAQESITHCIHLAAQPGVRYSIDHPHPYIENNVMAFLEILEFLRKCPWMKLIYASSSSVYGLTEKNAFSETDRTDRPASLYAVTKKTNELMAFSYHHLYGIPSIGLRFFTVYGPWGRPDMAYFSFTKAISEGRPIEVFNFGKMKRDFTYVDDIIEGIVGALYCTQPLDVFNLGNNSPEELMHLIHIIEKRLGKKAEIIFKPMQGGDITATLADISKSQKLLGFVPKVSLETGMNRFIDWYTDYYKVESLR